MSSQGPPNKKFRKHTPEERREEKRRYRTRQKEIRKRAQETRPASIDQAMPGPSGLIRGKKMVNLAKKPGCAKATNLAAGLPKIHKEQLSYNRDDFIGSGSYGNCYRGTYRGNIPVVLKKFKQSSVDEVLNEALAIQELQKVERHPCLPLLIGVYYKSKPYMIITQFQGGSDGIRTYTLTSAVETKVITDKLGWIRVLIQLSKALGFVHNCGYLHKDLKENNVVLHYSKKNGAPLSLTSGRARSCQLKHF